MAAILDPALIGGAAVAAGGIVVALGILGVATAIDRFPSVQRRLAPNYYDTSPRELTERQARRVRAAAAAHAQAVAKYDRAVSAERARSQHTPVV
jgi:hypothetical protein